MPLKIIADYRELLIDIFFAIIITIGLEKFLYDYLFPNILKLSSFDIPSLINVFSIPEALIDTFFFFAAYFWVISHWIFYHELIKKYPYYNPWKFFVDITLFSIMFVIINISYSAYDSRVTPLFILLVAVWYFFACLWHVSDKEMRSIGRYVRPHIKRVIAYSIILVLAYDPLSANQIIPFYRDGIMVAMIVAMIGWNVNRLARFMSRDVREYKCDYIQGFPGWDSSHKEGKLQLERNPMKSKVGIKKKDTITFYANDNLNKIVIHAENVIDANIATLENKMYSNDLMLEIDYKDENGNNIRLILNLSDQIITQIRNSIKALCKNNRKMAELHTETKLIQYLDNRHLMSI